MAPWGGGGRREHRAHIAVRLLELRFDVFAAVYQWLVKRASPKTADAFGG